MSTWRALSAVLACVLASRAARAAESGDAETFRLEESMSERLVVVGPRGDREIAVRRSRSLRASFELPVDPTITVALTGESPVSLRIGSLEFDATLEDDPRFTPLRRSASFLVPPAVGEPPGEPYGTLKLRWSGRRISVRVRGPVGALLPSFVPPAGSSRISLPAEATLTVGDGSWLFLGTSAGRSNRRPGPVPGASPDFARARVSLVGKPADPSADRVAPSIDIRSPGAIVIAGLTRFAGTASDDRGVSRVFWSQGGGPETEARFDAEASAGEGGGETGTFDFDALLPAAGLRNLRVRVVDAGGNSAAEDLALTVLRTGFLATGGESSFVLRDDTVLAWGADVSGQIGDGPDDEPGGSRETPSVVPQLAGSVAISASDTHTVTLRADGTVWSCGANSSGQLGDGTRTAAESPVETAGLAGVRNVAAGWNHSIALRSDGTVWCWGSNSHGQCGDGVAGGERLTPVQVADLPKSVAVAAGHGTSFALGRDGVVRSWGFGTFGTLGNSISSSAIPREVGATMTGGPFHGVVEIAVGTLHALARRSDGTVWAWGFADDGALGIGSTAGLVSHLTVVPVLVQGVSGATSISASSFGSAAVLGDGTVVAWGNNRWGEIGDGTRTKRESPVAVPSLRNVVRIVSGHSSRHMLAVLGDDTVLGWGSYTTGTPLHPSTQGDVWTVQPMEILGP